MEMVASLDMGSETMVMALGEKTGDRCHLIGVKSIPSEGIKRGKIVDNLRAKASIQRLLEAFEQDHEVHIDSLNIALSGVWVKQFEDKENIRFSRQQTIHEGDIQELEKRCRGVVANGDETVVDIIPMAYYVEQKEETAPVGISARRFDARFRVYVAKSGVLEELKALLAGLGVEHVEFYSVGNALSKALMEEKSENRDFALVDLGADSTKVLVIRGGMVVWDTELPLGCRTIDSDLNVAFSIRDINKAKRLKEEYGMALRAECKNRKIIIPDTKYCIESHNLAYVEQCRLEELLEGAIFQMQKSGYYEDLKGGILLTGGGSRIEKIQTLLAKLSGHEVHAAKALSLTADKESYLKTPEYLTALGLLLCEHKEYRKVKTRFSDWLSGIFKE